MIVVLIQKLKYCNRSSIGKKKNEKMISPALFNNVSCIIYFLIYSISCNIKKVWEAALLGLRNKDIQYFGTKIIA